MYHEPLVVETDRPRRETVAILSVASNSRILTTRSSEKFTAGAPVNVHKGQYAEFERIDALFVGVAAWPNPMFQILASLILSISNGHGSILTRPNGGMRMRGRNDVHALRQEAVHANIW